jgi:hypothetical protein
MVFVRQIFGIVVFGFRLNRKMILPLKEEREEAPFVVRVENHSTSSHASQPPASANVPLHLFLLWQQRSGQSLAVRSFKEVVDINIDLQNRFHHGSGHSRPL